VHLKDQSRSYPGVGMERQKAYKSYAEFLKPRVAQLLSAFRLDILFHRGEGDRLFYLDDAGREISVLDLVGGFGASLFGHNHPELTAIAQQALADRVPFNVQGSVRGQAGLLAQALSERVGRFTGRRYVATLANSGAEAVEAAVKHSEMERFERNQKLLEKTRESIRKLRLRLREGAAILPADLPARAGELLGEPPFATLDAMLEKLEARVRQLLDFEPQFLAIAGGFHGKSTGALQLTHREEFRLPWQQLGVNVAFIPRDDETALLRAIDKARLNIPAISFAPDGKVTLEQIGLVNIAACFCEPVQGEGGVHELSPGFLHALRRCADSAGFPLVLDEIQSGMGRCGTFLASEQAGVRGDYYLLSKSLGGGLAKVSALLVDAERYQNEFGYLHTSTFAEDDYSSAIALGALALLDRDQDALIKQCRQKGEAFLQRLRSLQERFPEQVREVRGRGLMIGVELEPQLASTSPLLRLLSEQNVLSYLVAGYLLHGHGVRVCPTLAERAVIRIEPSAYVSAEDCQKFYAALECLLTGLRDGNTEHLLRFAIGNTERRKAKPVEPGPLPLHAANGNGAHDASHSRQAHARVAFLIHFSTAADLQSWETGLSSFMESDCAGFLDRTKGLLRPFVLHETKIHSTAGKTVELVVIGVPFTAAQAIESMRDGSNWCLEMVKEGIELARGMACKVVGLGGHTSIVSLGGRALMEDELALTSGNSLTVAAAYEALLRTARGIGLDPASCRLGIVGAAGNVGAALAELAADDVGSILLVARKNAGRLMAPVVKRIYAAAFQQVREGQVHGGLAQAIAKTKVVSTALSNGGQHSGQLSEEAHEELVKEMEGNVALRFSDSLETLQSCHLVISATNAARPVITPAHIGDGKVVVCDVAVPQDVEPAVERERPSARVIRGGILRAPLGQELGIPAVPLRGSEIYGCLAETLLLGFAGCDGHFSYGALSLPRIRQAREWAITHGFEIVEK
jgi:acetylornithine/succinyldiaminopimelate/putrescine aminotransferase/predicted amino acid dehydrogenase